MYKRTFSELRSPTPTFSQVYGIAKVPHLLFTKEDSTDQRVLTTEDGHVRIDFGTYSTVWEYECTFFGDNMTILRKIWKNSVGFRILLP